MRRLFAFFRDNECYGDVTPTILKFAGQRWIRLNSFSMRRSHSLILSFGLLACSATAQNVPAQADPNDLRTAAVLTKLAQPSYPQLALQARIQGDVVIMVGVRRDGSVESVSLTSGHPILARAALQSAQDSGYECRRCSDAVTSYPLVYTFRLEVPAPGQPQDTPVTQLGNHVTVTDEPSAIDAYSADPPSTFLRRSAKCLYLWKCGLR
jgi:TonB family protein